MDLVKSQWVTDGTDRITMSMPIAKIDKANRRVSGWATLDNIDKTNDIVTKEASASAFERFDGGIREMHQPIAAGTLLDFKQDQFYDATTNKSYTGIFVTTYISVGAEDTWQKVLDGTLKAFSIGGAVKKASNEFNKDAGITVRKIEDYDLIELSLVDNPGNQHSYITSVFKMDMETNLMKGILADTVVANVFWCANDEIATDSTSESATCFKCGNAMEIAGWVEKGEDEQINVATTIANFLRQKEGHAVYKNTTNGEGGVTMSEEIKKDAEVEEVSEQVSEPVTEDASTEVVEEAAVEAEDAKTEEVVEAATEPDFEKLFDDLKGSVKESIEKTIESVEKKVEEATKAFDEKASEFEKSLGELGDRLDSIKSERADVTKRLDALEAGTAIKKSGEVETAPEGTTKVQKGFWNSTFFGEYDE